MLKPDSLILDVDGTLWDSTSIIADAWNEIVDARDDIPVHFTAYQLSQLFGRPLSAIADIIFPFLEEKERYALMDTCCEREHERLHENNKDILYPGVADTIRELSKNHKIFIVSNCQAGYIELFLEKTGLAPYVTDFECPGNTGLGKGANIRLIIERNHLNHPIYVGDIKGDQLASSEAGIPFCHASYGFGKVEEPDYTIEHFSDLLTIF